MPKKPTIQDVADATGVHRNTVSKILHGSYDGDPETIKTVQNVAEHLGVRPQGKLPEAPKKRAEERVRDSELPKGCRLVKPEVKMTKNHEWTLHYEIEVGCEFEYDQDEKGNAIPESRKVVDTEFRHYSTCFAERPTLRQIESIIAQQRSMIPDAV